MYKYETEKPKLFTEKGSVMLMAVRDDVREKLKLSGAIRMDRAWTKASGDSWLMMACVDRLVEMGDIREIDYGQCAGQHRIFVLA